MRKCLVGKRGIMKQTVCHVMFFLGTVFLFSWCSPIFAAPQLIKVFDKERSDKEDAVFFRNNDVLKGEVLNQDFTITTPYGMLKVPLDKCAGISFEGSRSNTEALVTVNLNRYTGIINDRIILFKIGSSGTEIKIRKEKIRFILLRTKANEAELGKSEEKTDLFIMANGDLLTGNPAQDSFTIATDYAKIPVSFAETKAIEMQGGDNVTAVIKKKNGDVMRGTLVTEEFSIELDIDVELDKVYKDKFAQVFVDDGNKHASEKFGVLEPIHGESDGAQFGASTASVKERDGHYGLYADGVVLDKTTGLEWLVGPDKNTTWDEADHWVANVKEGLIGPGGKGWRMPTINELESLYKKGVGTRNMTPLLKTTGWWVWSNETKNSSGARAFRFHGGLSSWYSRSYSKNGRAFAVRSRSDG